LELEGAGRDPADGVVVAQRLELLDLHHDDRAVALAEYQVGPRVLRTSGLDAEIGEMGAKGVGHRRLDGLGRREHGGIMGRGSILVKMIILVMMDILVMMRSPAARYTRASYGFSVCISGGPAGSCTPRVLFGPTALRT
jgi:hypothetical protein